MINEVIGQINEGSLNTENTMTSDKIHKLATIAIEDIKRAHSRLDEIQDCCRHKDTEIILIEGFLKISCNYCYKVIGYTTKEEIKQAGYKIWYDLFT